MPIPEPIFDTRTYRDILNEALARIPVHNPEWTNFNDADPGVTLLQLFAFMSESIIYRANRIPERNRRKFLRLLGIPVRAAEAALGMVVFTNPRGALETTTLAEDQELLAGKVPFRTLNGLQVLPIEARAYYKSPLPSEQAAEVDALYRRLYASFETEQQKLAFYESKTFVTPKAGATLPVLDLASAGDTLDGALWLALLARPTDDPADARKAIANHVLTLGVLPALGEEGCVLLPGDEPASAGAGLIFEVPNTETEQARYRPLAARTDTDLLTWPGVVELSMPGESGLRYWDDLDPLEAGVGNYPPSLEETDDQGRLITWIRIRPAGANGQTASQQLRARLSWVGLNAAQVVQRSWVAAERLPDGTGEPDQGANLINTPVILDSVRLTVNGEVWQRIDDLTAAPPEVPSRSPRLAAGSLGNGAAPEESKVFTLDRESGEIRFGNGVHGTRPPVGAVVQVAYAYGGGREGTVGIGAINKGPNLAAGLKVTNPVPTYGGDQAETVSEAEQRVPSFIKHRDRLVSEQDFRDITQGTPGVELGRVEVLSLFHPEQAGQLSSGVVTVLVIPRADPIQPEAPVPDRLFLETVCQYLAPRRLVTTELHVRGPEYADVWVSVGIEVVPGREQGPVREAVKAEIQRFLSPLEGGFESEEGEQGWPLNKAVEAAELAAAATRVSGVAKVNVLLLGDPSGVAVDRVELSGLELPRLRAVAVSTDDTPPTLEELRGEAEQPEPTVEGARVVPVPVVPESC